MTFSFESVKQWLVSQYYSKREFISVSRGATDKNRPVIVGTDGKLDGSLIDRADIFSDAEGDPANVGTAADGTSTYAARRDHVHDIAANYVDNTRLADMVQAAIKGRASAAGTGDPTDLTAAQVITILLTADGAASLLDADFLDGLDSTAFAILAGQAAGQTLNGSTAASGNLTLSSTANATKGKVLLGTASAYDQANDRLGIGTTSPTAKADISSGTSLPLSLTTSSSGPWAIQLTRSDLPFTTEVFNDGTGWYFNHNPSIPAKLRIRSTTTPASASAAGTAGDFCYDGTYFYICVAANTWHRTLHATW